MNEPFPHSSRLTASNLRQLEKRTGPLTSHTDGNQKIGVETIMKMIDNLEQEIQVA